MADEAELKALMLKGLAGDEAAHRAFLVAAAALLRAFFRNRLRGRPEDAEDLVQETLVALHTRRDTYDPTYPITAWFFAIARYRLIDHLRRAKHRTHAPLDDYDVANEQPDHESADARLDIVSLLGRLPEKQRTAITMVKLEERSVRETAASTGLSESDVKVSIHRGLKTLMTLLRQEAKA